jgi:hypothetical protein
VLVRAIDTLEQLNTHKIETAQIETNHDKQNPNELVNTTLNPNQNHQNHMITLTLDDNHRVNRAH